jgi:flagellar biosynthesis protein FlhF
MNPYTKLSPARQAAPERALFAPEVYLEEDDLLPAKAEKKDPMIGEISRLRNELRGEARALRTQMARPPRVPAELLAEIATLRAAVDELLANSNSNSTQEESDNTLASVLRRRGIEGGAASAITRIILAAVAQADEDVLLTNELLREAASMIVKTAAWPAKTMSIAKAKMLVALVGPAGVGKTTTAAKLAARAKMARKSVALVSCDSFRVGAMDQLQKYAELMDATFHSATTQDELLEILAKETADVIIVDTSGRAVQGDATEALLGSSDVRVAASNTRKVEVLLCVPASLRANDAARVHRDFATAQPTGLIVTKTDETDAPAGILHAAFATRLPITTICDGQRVPEDIRPATDETIGSLLFPNTNSKGNVSK